jgi:geranylgeranyl pyrophosphate synthase
VSRTEGAVSERLERCQSRVTATLERYLPAATTPPTRLHEALRYAVLGPGKRIRPVLCYTAGEAIGVPPEELDGAAAALELIHAYSLIHDDLPAMDDDDLRRGRPTTHRAFDEATAILAGDALQVLAFEILATDTAMTVDPAARVEMVRLLAVASGTSGMAGGQAMDLAAAGNTLALAAVEEMHRRKTGALIAASVMLAAAARPQLAAVQRRALERYGQALGLAFQIVDDLLDVEGDPAVVGKPVRADAAAARPTFPAVAGIAASQARAAALRDEALAALRDFDVQAEGLRRLAHYIVDRRQ